MTPKKRISVITSGIITFIASIICSIVCIIVLIVSIYDGDGDEFFASVGLLIVSLIILFYVKQTNFGSKIIDESDLKQIIYEKKKLKEQIEIAELKNKLNPEICRVVFKDNGFKDSAVKTNVMQKLKQHNIEEVRSI